MITGTEVDAINRRRAVRFFWVTLSCASAISIIGNVAHAIQPYIPHAAVQIAASAVPPVALLAAVHGIALAVRAGASGRIFIVAVGAVATIGAGAFAMSFLALRDLMCTAGHTQATAWVFPGIVDTTVAVSMVMLVALGDKPDRPKDRARVRLGAKPLQRSSGPAVPPASEHKRAAILPLSASTDAPSSNDESVAVQLVASRLTKQSVQTVVAVLAANREGATINAAARAAEVNFRTAKKIIDAARNARLKDISPVKPRA